MAIARGAGLAMSIVLLAMTAARAENVPLHLVPKPVLDAVRARFKDARITRVEKDLERGDLVYEVVMRRQGQNIDVVLTPDGVMLLIKREIAAIDLPAPVADALAGRYPRATYQTVEAVSRVHGSEESLAYYEIDLVTAQRRILEVRVSPDGTFVKTAP